jgi:formylglycine-generating enzyme required for sulfatase activity
MAGNVWEWCLTKFREDYKNYKKLVDQGLEGDFPRMLRGGSWDPIAVDARCAARDGGVPGNRDGIVGFRMVASPFSEL